MLANETIIQNKPMQIWVTKASSSYTVYVMHRKCVQRVCEQQCVWTHSNSPDLLRTRIATTTYMKFSAEVTEVFTQDLSGIPKKETNLRIIVVRSWVHFYLSIIPEIYVSDISKLSQRNVRALHHAKTVCVLADILECHEEIPIKLIPKKKRKGKSF